LIDEVECGSNEERLIDCSYRLRSAAGDYSDCDYAGVRCNGERLRVKNVSAATYTVSSTAHTVTVMISWELYSGVPHKPTSFRVECSNRQQVAEFSLWVNNETLTQITVGNLPSATPFSCCVLAIYYDNYGTEKRCQTSNQTFITMNSSSMIPASQTVNIGGVLGSIIAILLLLLVLCGGALLYLLYLLRSKGVTSKR
jgi:hypothetical protein